MSNSLAEARVDPAVWKAFPDYVAVVMAVSHLQPGPSSGSSEELLGQAEEYAIDLLGEGAPHDLPEVAIWREAYASFGVKPRDARSSVESLLRRVPKGLPRIDRLTDTYNAISILHRMPIGGENLDAYVGAPRLSMSDGTDTFDTVVEGARIDEPVPSGEVVWQDEAGVTCRRWNWRQCVRTRLDERTVRGLFIVDGLGPHARERALAAAEALVAALRGDSPNLAVEQVVLAIPND